MTVLFLAFGVLFGFAMGYRLHPAERALRATREAVARATDKVGACGAETATPAGTLLRCTRARGHLGLCSEPKGVWLRRGVASAPADFILIGGEIAEARTRGGEP